VLVLAALAAVTTQRTGSQQPPSNGLSNRPPIVIAALRKPGAESVASLPLVSTPMTYHGGPVQHTQKVYTIFWDPPGFPAFPANYQANINQFIGDLNQSSYRSIANQYVDLAGAIGLTVVFGGTWLDTTNAFETNPPNSVTDLPNEIGRAKAANPGWTDDADTFYLVYTPSTVGTATSYCGYHVLTNPAYGLILFPADHEFPNQGTCFPGGNYPTDQYSDSAINTTAHEVMETAANPQSNATPQAWYWQSSASGEMADLCNFNFGTRFGNGANTTINGHAYLVQQLWSNGFNACALKGPIVAGTIALTTEATPNGRLDPGEAVGIQICPRNLRPVASSNVTETLLASGGVTSPSGAVAYGSIPATGTKCGNFTFTVSASAVCGTPLTVSMQTTEVTTTFEMSTQTYTLPVGRSPAFSSQRFDTVTAPALPSGWTTSTLSGVSNPWVTSAAAPSESSPNHAFVRSAATASDSVLVSPAFVLPAGASQVSFRQLYTFEAGYDGGVLEISIAGGPFTDILAAGGTFAAGGYDGTIINCCGQPLANRQAWTSNTPRYVTTIVNMPGAAAGQSVQLRWRAAYIVFKEYPGWLVDNVAASTTECGVAAPTFTNDPLAPAATIIKAVHITEPRARIDAVRIRYGLTPFTYTHTSIAAGTAAATAVDFMELRAAIADVYALAGFAPPVYTHGSLIPGAVIQAVDLTEIRQAIVAIE